MFNLTIVAEISNEMEDVSLFDWSDYTVFGVLIIISILIGIYFGCFGSKQKTTSEYLLGGKAMKILPVALSLVAGNVSGTTLIGVPTEVYTDGALYFWMIPSLLVACMFVSYFFIPVFCELNITSAYEYLELRFNRSVRSYASFLYVLHCIIYLPVIIYVPSLSLSHATGFNIYLIASLMVGVCVFYTTIGGVKAVVWADFFQTLMTIISCLAIVIIGTANAGGVNYVLSKANEGGRLDILKFDPNPFQRNTFWTATIGTFFIYVSVHGSYQSSIQRFLSLRGTKEARRMLVYYWLGITFLVCVSLYGGLLVFAVYYGCDPIKQNVISKADQIFPHYVMEKIGYVPALPGLFLAGIFSAALSSMSTAFNTIAGLIYEDYLKLRGMSEERGHVAMKLTIVALGVSSTILVMIVDKLGNIFAVSAVLNGITASGILTLFVLGMFLPFSNSKGAMTGSVFSVLFILWIGVGASISKVNYGSEDIYKNINSTCIYNEASFELDDNPETTSEVFWLFKLSYMFYKALGTTIGVLIGIVVSYWTGFTDLASIDAKLITPPLRRFLPKNPVKEIEMLVKN